MAEFIQLMGKSGIECTPLDQKGGLSGAIGHVLAFCVGVGLLRAIRPSEDKDSDDR
jgi:hypothetical protein